MENYWMSKRSLAAAMTLTLASCGPSGTVVYYADYGRYSGSAATYAGIDGYIPVEVIGNPTEAESSHFAEHIVQGLDGSHFNPAIRFVASDPTDDSQYRVVAVFGAARQGAICSQPPPTASGATSPGPMATAFCDGDEAASFVSGRVPTLTGADDPALGAQLQAMGKMLFPPTNPNYSHDCEEDSIRC